jgi:hypothetical protein
MIPESVSNINQPNSHTSKHKCSQACFQLSPMGQRKNDHKRELIAYLCLVGLVSYNSCVNVTGRLLIGKNNGRIIMWWCFSDSGIISEFGHGRDHIVVGFTTTCAISAYHH